ncbi:hypothetical protein YYE_04416 [Plasmodium vinckei vinckei]|uniref:PIR protein CIR protein n=1 Tax=Plasmodium vinckei vinckei TaxID=54757 RepID=A0A081IA79_PLAVN|nr:hypothetical protein YYE_04416 [Plasmodium vinckei vinckei]
MVNSRYIIEDLYKDIYRLNAYFELDYKDQLTVNENYGQINKYCGSWCESGKENCQNYIQLAICGFIYLLEYLKKYGLEDDKLVEYAILWLSYKLEAAPNKCGIKLNEFYTKYIEKNDDYNKKIKGDENMIYKAIINKKKEFMNISELSKFNNLFNMLFLSYYEIDDESTYCSYYSYYPQQFVRKFEELNNDSNNIKDSLYSQILSTLSDDYKNLKKTYDDTYNYTCGTFPDLPELNPKIPVEKSGINSEQTLGQSSYSIEDLYKEINAIDGYFGEDKDQLKVNKAHKQIDNYCHSWCVSENGDCRDYFQLASCGVNYLLYNLKDKFDSKYDKLVEYAILWLSYKLNQKPKYSSIELNDFYTKYIETNDNYNMEINDNGPTCKEIIDKKKDLMDNNEISKFNYPFSILCTLYNGIKSNKLDCEKYSNHPKLFASNFEELNNDSSIIGNASYRKLLSTLSDDYNNLINNYDNINSCDFPTLSPVKTSSSSSIASKLIPGLSVFAIPAFLGIAYKYSLFGIDKVFQRQYIRNKLKKIKNKMKLNI